jgi:hypothetical protein
MNIIFVQQPFTIQKTQNDELLDFADCSENSSKAGSECKYPRKPELEQLDKMLHDWFVLEHSEGVVILGPILVYRGL